MAMIVLSIAFCTLALGAQGSSLYIAKLCQSQFCTDSNFPILDYVAEEDRCVCRANPCWNDHGLTHDCSLESGYHLAFSYTPDRNLSCVCSRTPHYSTTHISKDLCPGQDCQLPDYPVLDWDPDEKRCLCRSNPCWNEPGAREKCTDPLFPILVYREDVDPVNGLAKPVCECKARANKPKPKETRLRGSSDEGQRDIVILANGDRCVTPTVGQPHIVSW
jgi:hypothetical protein